MCVNMFETEDCLVTLCLLESNGTDTLLDGNKFGFTVLMLVVTEPSNSDTKLEAPEWVATDLGFTITGLDLIKMDELYAKRDENDLEDSDTWLKITEV